MEKTHPAAVGHLPPFITGPGQTGVLYIFTVVLLIGIVLAVGVFYLRLHALPERIAHGTNKVQLEIVAVLALLALFTHDHLFWIAALLLAFIPFPDFSTPIASMARSLEKLARAEDRQPETQEEDREPDAMKLDRPPEDREAASQPKSLAENQTVKTQSDKRPRQE